MCKRIIWWCLTVASALLILGFSAQSATKSNGISNPITHIVVDKIPEYQELPHSEQKLAFDKIHKFVRSIAHLALFSVLGFCASMLACTYAVKLRFVIVFLSCAVFAVLDEGVQHVLHAGRTFQVEDLLKDCFGSLVGILIVMLIEWVIHRRKSGGQNDGVSGSVSG